MQAGVALFDTGIQRSYIPSDLKITGWEVVKPFFDELLERDLSKVSDLQKWLQNRSELEAALQEDLGWRYIRMSCDTANEKFAADYNFFVSEIQPKLAPLSNQLDLKLLDAPALKELKDPRLEIMLRQMKKRVEIFRDENIPLIAEVQQLEQHYSVITGAMTVEVDGQEITLQQATNYLEQNDRTKREEVYRKILARRLQDRDALDTLFDQLLKLRHQIALNAGFANFRDYMFASLGRFDYTPEDCVKFHNAVAEALVPLINEMETRQKANLQLDDLRPWDTLAEPAGTEPLLPFADAADLMQKTITCFDRLDPFLGDCMRAMNEAKRLDLDSRKGKAPGGYNYPLYETGLPFIFMNSTRTLRDLVTMVHEGGHAVQSILDKPLELVDFKSLPSEIAELASMSMELMTMEHWDEFFGNPKELARARVKHLQDILKGLPWIAAVDAFQHWIYLNPEHTAEQRRKEWSSIIQRFSGKVVNWEGLEDARENLWQRQLHIYEVPFYYIEYGFAQLGAIAVWRNFRSNPKETIHKYQGALKLGYTCTIGEVYKVAGVRFDFSADYVRELCAFVKKELDSNLA
jgi:oligoendopeptidase F